MDDLQKCTVAVLKKRCKEAGVAQSGEKPDLVNRLKQHAAGEGVKAALEGKGVVDMTASYTRFYSQRVELFSKELSAPHRGGAASQASYKNQLYSLIRRVYNAESTLWGFAETVIALAKKHQQYPTRMFALAAIYTLTNTKLNRYHLPKFSFNHLFYCIMHGFSQLDVRIQPTFIFA